MQTDRTIRAIRNLGLKVAEEKTEAMMFHGRKGKRPPNNDHIMLEGKEIKIGRKLKYLGMILDSKMGFTEHFRYIQEKVEKVRRALCRLMPNLRGPHENKKRLYAYIVQSIVMYGAPYGTIVLLKIRQYKGRYRKYRDKWQLESCRDTAQ